MQTSSVRLSLDKNDTPCEDTARAIEKAWASMFPKRIPHTFASGERIKLLCCTLAPCIKAGMLAVSCRRDCLKAATAATCSDLKARVGRGNRRCRHVCDNCWASPATARGWAVRQGLGHMRSAALQAPGLLGAVGGRRLGWNKPFAHPQDRLLNRRQGGRQLQLERSLLRCHTVLSLSGVLHS